MLARFEWDKTRSSDVDVMRATFQRHSLRGKRFFAVGPTGRLRSQITEFDPNLERMALLPPLNLTAWDRISDGGVL